MMRNKCNESDKLTDGLFTFEVLDHNTHGLQQLNRNCYCFANPQDTYKLCHDLLLHKKPATVREILAHVNRMLRSLTDNWQKRLTQRMRDHADRHRLVSPQLISVPRQQSPSKW